MNNNINPMILQTHIINVMKGHIAQMKIEKENTTSMYERYSIAGDIRKTELAIEYLTNLENI